MCDSSEIAVDLRAGEAGCQNDSKPGVGSQSPTRKLESVYAAGHHDVGKEEINLTIFQMGKRGRGVLSASLEDAFTTASGCPAG